MQKQTNAIEVMEEANLRREELGEIDSASESDFADEIDDIGITFNNNADANRSEHETEPDTDSEVASSGCIERIEDDRHSLNLEKKKENKTYSTTKTRSENDVSLINQPLSTLKTHVEEKILGRKLCKECFVQSIHSHLSMLGIVSASNSNLDVLEDTEDSMKTETDKLFDDDKGECPKSSKNTSESLLKSLHRRTLSEIDWHELTRFAQGEVFDYDSTTAKEIKKVIDDGKDELSHAFKLINQMDFDFVVEEAEKCVQCVMSAGWRVVSHWELPQWLRDNDFLWHSHRPQLPSMKDCFGSMFRIHTETGNIWTHFVGLILVLIAMLIVLFGSSSELGDFPRGWEEYLVFTAFFIGAISCLTFSWLYHTCSCHSKKTSQLFSKLDYTGIACMIMGSFVPCVYYGFYCQYYEKMIYSVSVMVLGVSSIIVSLWDKFATPAFRPIRAGVFLALGCSGIVPVIHMLSIYGLRKGSEQGATGWLALMGICYIVGAVLYALRVPERFFPGKCNLMFQSHQIFHVLVVVAAFIHLHGCCQMATYRIHEGRDCSALNTIEGLYQHSNISGMY